MGARIYNFINLVLGSKGQPSRYLKEKQINGKDKSLVLQVTLTII